jgi:hypothetical protein
MAVEKQSAMNKFQSVSQTVKQNQQMRVLDFGGIFEQIF